MDPVFGVLLLFGLFGLGLWAVSRMTAGTPPEPVSKNDNLSLLKPEATPSVDADAPSISFAFVFARDEETSGLLRRSTREAEAGDWDAAIATLYAARERLVASDVMYPTETWCKLPLYLARAGRFDEADAALDWLLADLPRRKLKECGPTEPDASPERKAELKRWRAQYTRAAKDTIAAKRETVARRRARAEK